MNDNALNPYEYWNYEWNGSEMVRRRIEASDVRRSIDAHRGDSIFKPVHVPVEEANV